MQGNLTDAEMRRQIEMLIEHMSDEEVRRAYAALLGRTLCPRCKGDGKSRSQVLASNPPKPARCEQCDGRGWFGFEQQEGAYPGYGVAHLDTERPALGIRKRDIDAAELPPVVHKALDLVTDVNQHLVARNARLHRAVTEAYSILNRPASVDGSLKIHNAREALKHAANDGETFEARLRGGGATA